MYKTSSGLKYPSVTSVLGYFKAQALQGWRDRVGAEEANTIMRRASSRGTAIHTLCEQYILGNDPQVDMFNKDMFDQFRPVLDQLNNIHALETRLFSHHLQAAGTVDCIAEYQGKLHVVDFKTSLKAKRREWIHDYFMQTAAYAVMFEELTGISVNRLMVIIGLDEPGSVDENMATPQLQVFLERRDDWIGEFIEKRNEYKNIKGM